MILFLSAIKDIPASYNEAATIDGASKWHIFRYITFPLIKQTSIFILITTTIASFQVLDLIMVMTKGEYAKGNRGGKRLYIYDRSFNMMEMGYGSALSVFLFLLPVGFLICTVTDHIKGIGERHMKKGRIKIILLILFGIILLFPIYILFMSTFKSGSELFVVSLWPEEFTLDNGKQR